MILRNFIDIIQAYQEDIKGPYGCLGQWRKYPLHITPRNETSMPHIEMILRGITIFFEDD